MVPKWFLPYPWIIIDIWDVYEGNVAKYSSPMEHMGVFNRYFFQLGNFHGFPVATFDRKGNLRHLLGQRFSWYMKRNPSPSRHWQTPESQKSQVTSQQFLFQFFSSNRWPALTFHIQILFNFGLEFCKYLPRSAKSQSFSASKASLLSPAGL